MPRLYIPGVVHALATLRDDETGGEIEVDVGIHEYESIIIEPLSEDKDSLARIALTFTDGSILIEMGGPVVELVKAPWLKGGDLGVETEGGHHEK